MALVIEGYWEEIKAREAEFAGKWLSVSVEPNSNILQRKSKEDRLIALKRISDFAVAGVVVDDSCEGIYGVDPDRG